MSTVDVQRNHRDYRTRIFRNGQYKMQTEDRVLNADYVQNADCRLQTG